MHRIPFRTRVLPLAIAASIFSTHHALAQDELAEIEEVTVTGSYIKGAVTDAASPVAVIDRDSLMQQGAPSTVDIVQSMTFSSGTENQTNQFASGNTAGTANINLRGLGLSRTLVLMNGRRMVTAAAQANDGSAFVDINTVPALAINRIEVLKDGAGATYGSDAVAGVANFTTRHDFEGFEISGSFQDIDDSDGDYDFGAIWGLAGDNWNWVTSVGYRERSELQHADRLDDVRPRVDTLPSGLTATIGAPEGLVLFGQSTTGNPAAFIPVPLANMLPGGGVSAADADALRAAGLPGGLRAGFVRDPECEAAGGVLSSSNRCGYDFINFSNSIEQEEHMQLFSEFRYDLNDNTRLFGEVLFANSDVPEWKTSPSYPPLLEADPDRYLPADHPALLDFVANYPGIMTGGIPANGFGAAPADFSGGAIFVGRPVAVTGPAEEGSREHTTYRFLGGIEGEFDNGANYTASLLWAENTFEGETIDTLTENYTQALQGFGGPDCDGVTAGANGCQYYNPFSSAIPGTQFYDPNLANSNELLDWMKAPLKLETTSTLTVFEAVMSNDWIEMDGGNISYAIGVQYRDEEVENDFNDIADIDKTPGGTDALGNPTGAFTFLRGGNDGSVDQDVYAIFGEMQIPVTSNLDIQLALRYEDYGGDIGDTIDPKVAVRWDINDMFTLRGSASTTFRAPSLNQTTGQSTALEFIGKELLFKAVDRLGNEDLDAETATTYNLGVIMRPFENAEVTLDYWNFDFSDPIERESPNALVSDVAAQNGGDICGVDDRITCDAGGVTIARITTEYVNGPDITTNGLDLNAMYGFEGLGGYFDLNLQATYVFEYDVDEFQGQDSFDAVGSLNAATFVRPMQELKANFSVNYNRDMHNLRFVTSYIDDYTDNATDVLNGTSFEDTIYDRNIASHTTYDLFYTLSLNEGNTTLSASAINLTDNEAPYVRADLRYDARTHNAFGRMFKVGFTHKF